MKERTWTEEEIVRVLASRMRDGKRCSVTGLRDAGLGGVYNAAREQFVDLYEKCGCNWGKLVRELLAAHGESESLTARPVAARERWSRVEVERQLRSRFEANGGDATQMRASVLIASGFRAAYLWLGRQDWYAEEFGGSFPRFAASVLGLDLAAKGHELSGRTYTTDGEYIGASIDLTDHEREYFDGMLLGDGTILIDQRNPQRPTACFQLKSKYESVAKWAKKLLPNLGGGIYSGTENLHYVTKGGDARDVLSDKAAFFSRSSPYLLPLENRWYVEEAGGRRKIVPDDLKLTPRLMLAWYMGDGGAAHDRHGKASLRLHTHSFSNDEVRRLCLAIRGFGIGCSIDGVWGNAEQWTLRIPSSQAKRFLEIIGPPPVPELAHRWQLLRTKPA